ncbi:hypothetical protein M408DRAFT_250848 [Serendipita vermifera MAFF 305830]|uniref:Peptidase C14 caspase domain-containing protein n=1 Tax=Serendipita vermifera MAFF 305830 TaxID=933852 RepID=A0A0C2X2K6_SERVB|nr:hypothetical protein M408DRAFT_250848 [Serendipita vermifera MAFF 305830]
MDSFTPDSILVPIKTPNLRALLIGIDQYAAKEIPKLDGAVADAKAIESYLKEYLAVPDSQIKTLYDSQATRQTIIQSIEDLAFKEKAVEQNNPFLIYYAGHGAEGKRPTQGLDQIIQMIIPHDFKQPLDDYTVQGILDYEFNELLEQLANVQGDNITVILDCCHSGSGTRGTHLDTNDRTVRSIKIDEVIPNSRKGTRGSNVARGFLHTGLRSHILLAACSEKEKAMEHNGRGVFTEALLEALIATGGRVSYCDLLLRLQPLPRQTPQCEGFYKNRTLWNSIAMAIGPRLLRVRCEKESYILEAGTAHGVTEKTRFTIYEEISDYPSKAQGVFVVQSTDLIRSTLVPLSDSGTTIATESRTHLKPNLFALLEKVGEEGDFRLHIEDTELHQFVQNTLEEAQNSPLSNRYPRTIALVDKKIAQFTLGVEQDYVTFGILDPSVTTCGLNHMPFRVKRNVLASVIQYAAHFDWHLHRVVSTAVPTFQKSVRLEFTKIYKRNGALEVDKSNLNVNNRIDLVVGEDKYGIKLVNNSDKNLYPYLFFFDCSDLSIECYYDSPTARVSERGAPLRAGGALTIGYSATGWAPWSYSLRQPESIENGLIMQEGQDVDVGFLKLFLSSDPLDLSHMVQHSPFKSPLTAGSRGGKKEPFETLGFCETRIIKVIQRKEAAKRQGGSMLRWFWPNKWISFGLR